MALLALGALASGCATKDLAALTDPGASYGTEEDERKLIRLGDEAEAEFRRRGLVFSDSDLERYLDEVLARVLPSGLPPEPRLRVAVLRVPEINAFAMANGAIYLNTGLLARLDNEAQLAHVIAHETSHTVFRHQLAGLRDYQQKTVIAKVVSRTIGAVDGGAADLLMQFGHPAAVNGYQRKLEEQADLEGLRLMAAAGYSIDEAPRTFERLNGVEEPGAVEAFFYSSHPSNELRALHTRQMIESRSVTGATDGRIGAAELQQAVHSAVWENVRLRLRVKHYRFALLEVDRALERYGQDALLHCYRGDAHLGIAQDPEAAAREEAMRSRASFDEGRANELRARQSEELQAAIRSYGRALEMEPSLAPALRGLGLARYQQGQHDVARDLLERYLASPAPIPDRRYVQGIVDELSR